MTTPYNQLSEQDKQHTIEAVLEEMLATVPATLNKSELSPVSIALAPAAAQNIDSRIYADNIMDATMADTALGDDLTRTCAERGVNRFLATTAIRLGIFTDFDGNPADVPLSSRFGIDSLVFTAIKKVVVGQFELECELPGSIGDDYVGAILPIDNLNLGSSELTDKIRPGEDEESDEALRARYFRLVNARPFGGNMYQYRELLLEFPGVGDGKVFPTPNNQGGKVHCVIIGPPSSPILSPTFVQAVEDEIDPEPKGKGYGHAPIDHYVTVSTVIERAVDISSKVYLVNEYSLNSILPSIRKAVITYLSSLTFRDNVVRIARIESAILGVEGVADIFGTTLNGTAGNIALSATFDNFEIPQLGNLAIEEA